VTGIDESRGRIAACCHDGAALEADAAILTVPLPVLPDIALPPAVREKAAASTDIGFGNVVKNSAAIHNEMVGQSWGTRSRRPHVPVLQRNGSDLASAIASSRVLETTSGKTVLVMQDENSVSRWKHWRCRAKEPDVL
jgi:hypothetical protein